MPFFPFLQLCQNSAGCGGWPCGAEHAPARVLREPREAHAGLPAARTGQARRVAVRFVAVNQLPAFAIEACHAYLALTREGIREVARVAEAILQPGRPSA